MSLRAATRKLVQQKGVTAASIVTIAVGIGATAIMYTFTYATVVRGLPVPEPDAVVSLSRIVTGGNADEAVSLVDLAAWRERTRSFSHLGGFRVRTLSLAVSETDADRVSGAELTEGVLELLGVEPLLGRRFLPAEFREGAALPALVRESVWEERYGRSTEVLGSAVRIDGRPATIVGVMPDGFQFPYAQAVWIPLQADARLLTRGSEPRVLAVGRLSPGVTLAAAQRDVDAVDAALAGEAPETNRNLSTRIEGYTQAQIGAEIVVFMKTMLFAVAFVLVIASINVANLLLARTTARGREISVRRALGATRPGLVAQLLSETLLMAVIGGAAGLAIAWVGITEMNRLIVTSLGGNPFYWIRLEPDGGTILLTAGLVLVTTAVSGLMPALRTTSLDVAGTLRDEARGGGSLRVARLTKLLVGAQTVMSVGLLAVTGVMLASVATLRNRDYGIPVAELVYAEMSVDSADYPSEAALDEFWDAALARARSIPGVEAAALTTLPPVTVGPAVEVELRGLTDLEAPPTARLATVSPGYLAALGLPMSSGREFGDQDGRDAEGVAIVTSSFVDEHMGGRDPVGSELRVRTGEGKEEWRRIVGVAPELWMRGARFPTAPGVLLPSTQRSERGATVVVRTGDSVAGTVRAALRSTLEEGAVGNPVVRVESGTQYLAGRTFFYYFLPTLFGLFGVLAFGLAIVGMYGVTSYSMSTRTAEIGVRMALGADRPGILRWVLKQGLGMLLVSAALGLVFAGLLVGGLQRFLVGVNPRDPVVFGSAAAVMIAAGILAALHPAVRASLVSPVKALSGVDR